MRTNLSVDRVVAADGGRQNHQQTDDVQHQRHDQILVDRISVAVERSINDAQITNTRFSMLVRIIW